MARDLLDQLRYLNTLDDPSADQLLEIIRRLTVEPANVKHAIFTIIPPYSVDKPWLHYAFYDAYSLIEPTTKKAWIFPTKLALIKSPSHKNFIQCVSDSAALVTAHLLHDKYKIQGIIIEEPSLKTFTLQFIRFYIWDYILNGIFKLQQDIELNYHTREVLDHDT